jgi:hypothetical protein
MRSLGLKKELIDPCAAEPAGAAPGTPVTMISVYFCWRSAKENAHPGTTVTRSTLKWTCSTTF